MEGLVAKVIVVGATRYKFPNEETGEIIEGTKVHFVELNPQPGDNNKGFVTQQVNLPYDFYDNLKVLPGIYNAELTINMIGRKPGLKVSGFTLISAVEFKEKPEVKQQH